MVRDRFSNRVVIKFVPTTKTYTVTNPGYGATDVDGSFVNDVAMVVFGMMLEIILEGFVDIAAIQVEHEHGE